MGSLSLPSIRNPGVLPYILYGPNFMLHLVLKVCPPGCGRRAQFLDVGGRLWGAFRALMKGIRLPLKGLEILFGLI